MWIVLLCSWPMLDCKSPTTALVCSLSLDLSMWIKLWELNFRSKQRRNLDHISLFPCSAWNLSIFWIKSRRLYPVGCTHSCSKQNNVNVCIQLDANQFYPSFLIPVLSKRGIRTEMYQFSMLSTPFSFSIGTIDGNPMSLPEGKKPLCFHTPLLKKGW